MKALVEAYKALMKIADATAGLDDAQAAEHLARRCDEAANCLLRVMHEVGGYGEAMAWELDRAPTLETAKETP